MPSPAKAALCVVSLVLFVVTLALLANNRDVTRDGDRVNRVHAAWGLTGLCLGIVVAAMGAAFAFLDDIGKMGPAKAAWALLALIALWFIAGAFGIWVDRNERERGTMIPRYRTDLAFFILSSFFWLVTIAFVVVDPLEGGGCNAMKMPSAGLLGFTAVIMVIIIALAAANRDGRGNYRKIGEASEKFGTYAHWAAFALTGSVLGFVVALGGVGLLFAGMWGKDDAVSRYIRAAWVFFAAVSVWFLGSMCGIWANYARTHSQESAPGFNTLPWGSYFKAEFAFEIIGSVFMILSVVLLAAFGAGEEPRDA